MLASQGQPRRLGLINAPDAHSKNIVFVKLTDTSLEALTNYIKHANKTSTTTSKPTISFSHNSGTFTVPTEDGSQKFNFSLSSIDEQNGPQGSFECLETRRPGSMLESLGPVQSKVQVQASENDAYARFGERMSNVKMENEKRTTRYLDRTSSNSSNKIVSRKHILAAKTLGSRSNDLHRYSHAHKVPANSQAENSRANAASVPQNSMASREAHNQASNPSTTLINGYQPLNGSHPMLDRNKHKKPQNPEIMKRSLRERVVHLLAVRPYKKPEISERMNRDGLREKEKKELFPLVKQVSVMKDNTYHLQRHIWNDVSEDWPFYTEEERTAFRRRKPQNLTPPGSDGSTGSAASGHSSSSSHPASPQPVKRPLKDEEASNSPKRRRVSNYVRHSPLAASSSPELSGESKTNAWLLNKSNQEFASDGYKTKFVPIESSEQRRVYKAEFNKDYNRYMFLHTQVDRVSRRFAKLQRQLKHTPETSPEYASLKKMIVLEYQKTNDSQYKRHQEEFNYLHKKLAHIKKLVHDYDTVFSSKSSCQTSYS